MNGRHGARLLVVGLDGFDPRVAARLADDGKLPNLVRLRSQSHRFQLDPGVERYTGLAWEQFSSGLPPRESSRWSANTIDTRFYVPDQPATRLAPFTQKLDARTVIFDVPYFDLSRPDSAQGQTAWGSHDPGVSEQSKPAWLATEIERRFGPYPATGFIYGHVWPNADRTAEMARSLVNAVNVRSEVTRWLFGEGLPVWDLGITVISEYHSAIEAFWHGWDDTHSLHPMASAAPARAGIVGVYAAADRMLGSLLDTFPDASILAFAPHGMGRNHADVAAMLLLPELMYRHSTGQAGFHPDPAWALDGTGSPDLAAASNWSDPVNACLTIAEAPARRSWRTGFLRQAPLRPHLHRCRLDWMPAARYRAAWPGMKAYAIPAYYDGRVRVNLRGRESCGVVGMKQYAKTLDEVAGVIQQCRDPLTGAGLEIEIERHADPDPRERDATDADLIVRFRKDYYAFEHPRLGVIGPAPCRRPGGHTGGPGAGYLWGSSEGSSDLGTFPFLDIPDAVASLVGCRAPSNALGEALSRAETVSPR